MSGRVEIPEDDSSAVFDCSSDAPSPTSAGGLDDKDSNDSAEIILEGWVLKRNRNNFWQDRYFIFRSDQTLSYWRKQSKKDKAQMNESIKNGAIDSKFATSTFKISRQAGCDISDLYVEQRGPTSLTTSSATASPTSSGKKVTLYCIDISWTEDAEADIAQGLSMHQHNPSLEEFIIPQQDEDPSNNWDELSLNSSNSAARR